MRKDKNVEIHRRSGKNVFSTFSFAGRPANASFIGDGTIAAMIVSMALLAWAMKTLPVGTAYAVWTGIGAVGAAITGILLLGESANPMRLASLALIVVGIIGLKLSTH